MQSSDPAPVGDATWARSIPARAAREVIVCGVLGACMDAYTKRTIAGHENLTALAGPVLFVANHASHMDTPALLRALPPRWRRRTAVAAAADYFYADKKLAATVSLAFGTVPLQRRGGGLETLEHVSRLFADRWSLVMFAEGTRSRDGSVGPLRSGAAVLAARHGLPIVPVHVGGTHAAMPTGERWMSRKPGRGIGGRHPIDIRFGAPIRAREGEAHHEVMERVRLFLAECGAATSRRSRVTRSDAAPAEA
ncbi:MAG: 1-acyl-sn-glycerol-3-phosphate acyltransferase, partial [Solirubrobacterales bacterium]|nr:1-acyl-sn-glycerol-3-phosphate acyltransferase [Solirubrobacterales bacterium]